MPRWVFRGQSQVEWPLATSFERAAVAGRVRSHDLQNREWWILRQFQRRAHLVLASPPNQLAILEWLALIQHYGGPTRLLDFTYSPYIAAFFAVEFTTTDAAIWGVNLGALDDLLGPASGEETIDDVNRKRANAVEGVLRGQSTAPGILHVEPDRLNERMAIQQGVFLFPTDIRSTFMQNIAGAFAVPANTFNDGTAPQLRCREFIDALYTPAAPTVVKIIIQRDLHMAVMRDLTSMNIGAQSLFPGLDGFARSLHRHVRYGWRAG